MAQTFEFQKASIEDLIQIMPKFVPDSRGYLMKTFEQKVFEDNGICFSLSEEIQTRSRKGTVRGLHFQRNHSQDKLVRVLDGEVFDVVVDLRVRSATFGRWEGFHLSKENGRMLYIPKEFAHGFLTMSAEAELHYLCGNQYDLNSEDGIIWNDPDLGITWPIGAGIEPQLSERDTQFQTFAEYCHKHGFLT